MKKTMIKSNIFFIIIQFVATFMTLTYYLTTDSIKRQSVFIGHWGLITMLFTVWVFISWSAIANKIISYYNAFILVAVLFHFGQAWVEFLSPQALTYVSIKIFFSAGRINAGYYFAFCCLMALHLGALIIAYFGKHKDYESVDTLVPHQMDYQALTAFGILLLIPSLLCRLIIDIKLFGYVSQGGYLSIYENPLYGPFWGLLYKIYGYFYPSIFILLYCFRDNKSKWNLIYRSVIIYSLAFGFLIGNRGTVFMFVLALIIYRHVIYKKYTKKETISLALFSVAILMFSSMIALTRLAAKSSLSLESISSNVEGYNLIFSSISEFGGSIMTLLVGMKVIPDYISYGHGMSYLASTMVLIPDVFGVFNWLLPYMSFSDVLNDFHRGLGGSFIGEAFYNFGNYGIFFMGILGLAIGKYTIKLDKNGFFKPNSTATIWASLLFLSLLMFVRDQFYSLSAGLLQYCIYPWILYWLFKNLLYPNLKKL